MINVPRYLFVTPYYRLILFTMKRVRVFSWHFIQCPHYFDRASTTSAREYLRTMQNPSGQNPRIW